MVPTMTTLLPRFTSEWAVRLEADALLTVGREIGSTAWRDRVLTPGTTSPCVLRQMLPGHTAGRHLPQLSGWRGSPAASWHARATLPRHLFARLLERLDSTLQHAAWDESRGQGHRPWLGEDSGGSRPETPAFQAAFGQPTTPRPGEGVPVARLLGRFHAGSGGLLTRVVAPLLTHDRARGPAVQPGLPAGDGLGAARGLCASAPLARLVPAGVPAVLRVGARPSVAV
jgi:hypothetical protein